VRIPAGVHGLENDHRIIGPNLHPLFWREMVQWIRLTGRSLHVKTNVISPGFSLDPALRVVRTEHDGDSLRTIGSLKLSHKLVDA
jgi:hypothetical protein